MLCGSYLTDFVRYVNKKNKIKWPPRIKAWWPSICGLISFLYVSINKKPFFFS